MMREYDSDDDSYDGRPTQRSFNSKIEQELGYEIGDPRLRDEIANKVYNPQPKAEFGFDPTVVEMAQGELPDSSLHQPQVTPSPSGPPEPSSGKTNLVASAQGYVMPSSPGGDDDDDEYGEEEVSERLGYAMPSNISPPAEKVEPPVHKPYQPLSSVKESSSFDSDGLSNGSSAPPPTPSRALDGSSIGKLGADRIRGMYL